LRARPVAWQLQLVLLSSVWGASFLFIKVADRDLAAVDVALGRVALGAGVLVFALAFGRSRLPRGRGAWGHLALVGLIGNAIPFMLFAYGETRISSVLAGLWNATTPLLVLLVATFMLPDERPTGRRVAGLFVGFAGVVVVLAPWRGLGGSELLGQLMCLGAAACYGFAFPYTRRFIAWRPESGTALSAGQLLCATAWLAVTTVFVGGAPGGVSLEVVLSLLALGALGTGLAYILNYAIVRAAGATTAATVTYLVPIVSTALGVIVLGESVAWNQPVGAALALAAVAAQGLTGSRGSGRAPTA
jgi:drug/metabolite transporter (DMT)-like permease